MVNHLSFFDELNSADLSAFRPIPFWSWNDKLELGELRRQIGQMQQAGMGGFFMHARGGLETEYMGEEWFIAVETSADEAKKRGLDAWCYDENGWPSGFAGGKLLENTEYLAHFLQFKEKSSFDASALGVYTLDHGNLRHVLRQESEVSAYLCVYDCCNHSTVDILNPAVTDAFLDSTHEVYAQHFGERFNYLIAGFFTDEPQYFRYETAYSPVMINAYRAKYGRELLDELGALFIDCPQAYGFRFRYWRLMNELYTESFIARVQRWCHTHGCRITGHTVQEDTLAAQMWCCAGVMPFYEYEDIPGIDWLGRMIGSELAPRQVSSVAQQLGKKQVLTETFACAGWDVTPMELRRIAEFQYVHGVNLMCQHLFPYSIRGQRKRDYPAFYSDHNPWTQELRVFNEYFTKLGFLLANSKEKADVLLIHPMHNTYLTYDRNTDESSVEWVSKPWMELIERFGSYGIGHHYGDERLMEKYAESKDGRLRIGQCEYEFVVVPDCETLDRSTVQLLRAYLEQGGKLWFAGNIPTRVDGELEDLSFLRSTISFAQIREQTALFAKPSNTTRCTLRTGQSGDFLYAVNLSEESTETIDLRLAFGGAVRVDLQAETIMPLDYCRTSDGIAASLTFEPGESVILLRDDSASSRKAIKADGAPISIAQPMAIVGNPENALTLDMAALSYDGEVYTAPLPIPAISERLLREKTNRKIWLKYTFEVQTMPETLFAEVETLKNASLFANGVQVFSSRSGVLDRSFVRVELTRLMHLGRNELVLMTNYHQAQKTYDVFSGFYYGNGEITETLMNCTGFETNIESVYLFGQFSVHAKKTYTDKNGILMAEGFYLSSPICEILPENITQQGFFFFRGSMKLRTSITVTSENKTLRVKGRVQFVRVKVNGETVGTILLKDTLDLSEHLHLGENTLEFELMASNRNLFGPHHNAAEPEPKWVSPTLFSLYGTWQDGHSKEYRDNYAFVPFGLETIVLE